MRIAEPGTSSVEDGRAEGYLCQTRYGFSPVPSINTNAIRHGRSERLLQA